MVTRIKKGGVKTNVCVCGDQYFAIFSSSCMVVTMADFPFGGVIGALCLDARVRTVGLIFDGCTCQWSMPSHLHVEGIL
jgi:hypothetical protein